MAVNFKRILFCTDFSDNADNALLTALDMAERYQARFYVLHVLPSTYPHALPVNCEEPALSGGDPFISPEELEKATHKLMERYETKMIGIKTHYEFHVVCGVPFIEIIRFAQAQDVDCIILGAAGISDIKRITFGSTAENVARRAHCTVMVIRDQEKGF